uniref:HMA domain-containing protein n=1 Tax=Populus alba TaxID=43335 RepID=A0A4U5Q2X0_POPAL|nr:uncharacterized protein D5086_0000141690 [Populus alba]
MAQKVVLKVLTMTDVKTKQKAIEAAADIYGVDSIAADLKDQKLTVIGQMDTVAVVKRLKKVAKVDIISKIPDEKEIPEAPSGSIFVVNKGELNLYLSCQAPNDIINGVAAKKTRLKL